MTGPRATGRRGAARTPRRVALRARVVVPLLAALAAVVVVFLVVLGPDPGPFGPLRAAPPPDWSPRGADEIAQWAWDEGLAHYRAGEYGEAAVLLSRAAGALSRDPEPMFYAGVSHLMTGAPGVAADLIGRAVRRRPDEPLFRYYLAWACELDGRRDEAVEHLRVLDDAEGRYGRKAAAVLGRMEDR